MSSMFPTSATARLAQSAERKALNLVVVGSSPTVGAYYGRIGPMYVQKHCPNSTRERVHRNKASSH